MWVRSAGVFSYGLLSGVMGPSHEPPVNVPADYPTIQSAINAVSDGDTIDIASGMYRANLVLDKRITLRGAGSNSTIIQSDVANAPVITTTGSGNSADERLVIRGVKLTRTPQNGNQGSGVRIMAGGNYLTFDDVAATGNRTHGIDLDVRGTMTDIRILNCDLSGNGGAGVNQNSYAVIDRLLIEGTRCNRNMNGAYLNASLRGISIEGSRFENNKSLGLCVRAENDANFVEALPALVRNSSFNGNGWHGGTIDGRIRDSVSRGNTGGIILKGPLDRVHVQCNLIENNKVGIRLDSDSAANGSQANGNNIADHVMGIENTAPGALFDASYNWWGDATGPSGVGLGTGDSVSSGVVYDPWLNAPYTGLLIVSVMPRRIAVKTRFRISADVLGPRVVSVQYHVNGRSGEMTTTDGVMFAADIIDGMATAGKYELCIRAEDCHGNVMEESIVLIVYNSGGVRKYS